MNTAGFVLGVILSTLIMFGTVMAAHANASIAAPATISSVR
jgi:heme/copper-type cytochrome/quinol oxidase subunit 4